MARPAQAERILAEKIPTFTGLLQKDLSAHVCLSRGVVGGLLNGNPILRKQFIKRVMKNIPTYPPEHFTSPVMNRLSRFDEELFHAATKHVLTTGINFFPGLTELELGAHTKLAPITILRAFKRHPELREQYVNRVMQNIPLHPANNFTGSVKGSLGRIDRRLIALANKHVLANEIQEFTGHTLNEFIERIRWKKNKGTIYDAFNEHPQLRELFNKKVKENIPLHPTEKVTPAVKAGLTKARKHLDELKQFAQKMRDVSKPLETPTGQQPRPTSVTLDEISKKIAGFSTEKERLEYLIGVKQEVQASQHDAINALMKQAVEGAVYESVESETPAPVAALCDKTGLHQEGAEAFLKVGKPRWAAWLFLRGGFHLKGAKAALQAREFSLAYKSYNDANSTFEGAKDALKANAPLLAHKLFAKANKYLEGINQFLEAKQPERAARLALEGRLIYEGADLLLAAKQPRWAIRLFEKASLRQECAGYLLKKGYPRLAGEMYEKLGMTSEAANAYNRAEVMEKTAAKHKKAKYLW